MQQCLLELWEACAVEAECRAARWVAFFPLLSHTPCESSAFLEEIGYYAENNTGFSYHCNSHSDGRVLGRGSGILGDGERRRVCIWLGCPLKLAQDP